MSKIYYPKGGENATEMYERNSIANIQLYRVIIKKMKRDLNANRDSESLKISKMCFHL